MVHTSGFRMSPYADIKPAGGSTGHRSPARWPASCGTAAPGAPDDCPPRVGAHGPPPRTPYRRPHRGGLGRRPRAARRHRASSERPRHRRRHRRVRGPGRRARATGSPSSTPAPTPSPRSPAGPTRRASPTGSPASRATSATCASWRPRAASTWCCATACSASSTTRPPRWRRSPRCSVPAAPSPCWSASGTPPCSPGRWPATSSRPGDSLDGDQRPTGPGARRAPVHRRGGRPACSAAAGFTATTHARHPRLRRPGALLPARPRARCRRRPAGARARGRRAPRVPHPRQPAPRRRHPLRPSATGTAGRLRARDALAREMTRRVIEGARRVRDPGRP